jgi:ABC-type transport system involved in multi-copper enzyme maturation permease subunit
MFSALYAEFRKFTTIRSTYIWSILALLLAGAIAFWGMGYKSAGIADPSHLQSAALMMVSVVGVFVGVLAILHICHEFRYNTIGYTLTESNNRLKVLGSKFIIMGGYAIIMAVLAVSLTIGLTALGGTLADHHIGPQTIELFNLAWQSLLYMIGSAWLGLIIGFIARSLVAAIVAYFLIPTIEPLLNSLLKISNNYLPTASQSHILQIGPSDSGTFSAIASAGVFGIYLAIGLVAAIILFTRRDAS